MLLKKVKKKISFLNKINTKEKTLKISVFIIILIQI